MGLFGRKKDKKKAVEQNTANPIKQEEEKVATTKVETVKTSKTSGKTAPVKKAVAKKEEVSSKTVKKETKTTANKTTSKKEEKVSAGKTKETAKKPKKETAKKEVSKEAEVKTKKPIYRVLYDKTARLWLIKKDGAKRTIATYVTKEEALERVKDLSSTNDLNFIVHKKDGKFQKK